jgi:Aspartyl protease
MKHALIIFLLLGCLMGLSVPTAIATMLPSSPKSKVRVPFEMDRNLIVIHAQVKGGPDAKWIFDTGTQGLVVNAALADAWGLKGEGMTEMGRPGDPNPVQVRNIVAPELAIEGLALRDVAGIAAPEELFLPPGVAGIVGMRVLQGYLVTIDYAHAQLIIAKGALHAGDAGVVPVDLSEIVTGQVQVNGQQMAAHFDSGGPEAMSFPLEWRSQLTLKEEPVRFAKARTCSGEVDLYRAQLVGEVQIGAIKLTDPMITLVSGGFEAVNIGYPFLRDYTLTVDMVQGLIRLSAASKAR